MSTVNGARSDPAILPGKIFTKEFKVYTRKTISISIYRTCNDAIIIPLVSSYSMLRNRLQSPSLKKWIEMFGVWYLFCIIF